MRSRWHRSQVDDPGRAEAIVKGLADEYARKIILSTITAARSVEDLSSQNDIPLSTCYRRVHELLAAQMLVVERIVVTPEGKKYELVRSAYSEVRVGFEGGAMKVDVVVNEDVAEKLRRIWMSMKYGG